MLSAQILLGIYLLFYKKNQKSSWCKHRWILGHRGARSLAPENTIEAFILAMDYGADGVEFDVSLSQDGIPVVIHDRSVNRTTDKTGLVKDLSFRSLEKLNASKLKPGFEKTKIPSLKKTLECLPDNSVANIELKFKGNFSESYFIQKILEEISPHKNRLNLIISSFDARLLLILRKLDPSLVLSLILSPKDRYWSKALKYLSAVRPDALHISGDLFSRFLLRLMRRAKLKVAIWTINDPKLAQKLWALGIDGIFTDQVEKIVKAIRHS